MGGRRVCAVLLAFMGVFSGTCRAQSGIRIHMHGSDGYAADGMWYLPAGPGPFPGMVLVPDERGITARVTAAGERLAQAGFATVAVDLNRGLAPDQAEHSDAQAQHDLNAALAFLTAQSTLQSDRIGVLGWGSGGMHALRFAAESRVRAVAIEDVDVQQAVMVANLRPLQAAVLGSFAGRDTDASPRAVKAFEAYLRSLGATVETKVYADVRRGFDDPADPAQSNAAAVASNESRQRAFFATHLGSH